MKKWYLILAIIGFIIPSYFVLLESVETGNILLYRDIPSTLNNMFANRISTIFTLDLLFGVFVFFIWTYQFAETIGLKKILSVWILTLLFGFAGGFPLFLYLKSNSKIKN